MTWNQSDKLLTSSLRFSLLNNDLNEFLDILKTLQCDLQPIFEIILEILQYALQLIFELLLKITFGTMWKIGMKLGKKSA